MCSTYSTNIPIDIQWKLLERSLWKYLSVLMFSRIQLNRSVYWGPFFYHHRHQLTTSLFLGKKQLTCLATSVWDAAPPTCNPVNCVPFVASPENGFSNGDCAPGVSGKTCRFLCKDGFVLTGNGTITCFAGQWDSKPPTCNESA